VGPGRDEPRKGPASPPPGGSGAGQRSFRRPAASTGRPECQHLPAGGRCKRLRLTAPAASTWARIETRMCRGGTGYVQTAPRNKRLPGPRPHSPLLPLPARAALAANRRSEGEASRVSRAAGPPAASSSGSRRASAVPVPRGLPGGADAAEGRPRPKACPPGPGWRSTPSSRPPRPRPATAPPALRPQAPAPGGRGARRRGGPVAGPPRQAGGAAREADRAPCGLVREPREGRAEG
jgi:hypothetical protein